MKKTMLLLSGLPAACGLGTATIMRILSVLLAFCFICGGSGSLAAPPASSEPAKPLWQAKLSVEETDFIESVSNDRVLVGTINTSDYGGGLQPHEIMLLNSVTGEKVWAVPRGTYGSPQTLLAVDPAILIEGSKQTVALNPENGAVLWSRVRAGETSLLLPSHNLIAFLAHKAAPMTISAVNVKTGSEDWKTPIENYPVDKSTRLDVTIMGDAVLVSGPEVAAFSAVSGKLLWRMPFPGTFGTKSEAIPLGNDLYFSDGSVISRSDPASGKQLWRTSVSNGAFQAITENQNSVFILLKGSGENPPDSIAALDRKTGKQLWNSGLLDRAASPISTEENLLYVTTPATVIALNALDGSVVFKTAIPAELQSRRQLPDHLRIDSDRIIVAREVGVLAVRKSGGKLLFADQVVGGRGFTYDYSTARFRHASVNTIRRNNKHPVQFDSDSASPEENYRVAMAQQRVAFQYSQAYINNSMTNSMNMITSATTPLPGQNWSYQQQKFAAKDALAGSIAVAGIGTAAAILNAMWIERREGAYQAQVRQTFQTHAGSLQEKFYMRPAYEQQHGWSLYLVNLETGEHAYLLLSSDSDESPNFLAVHLPVFSIEGSRVISKGLGVNPEWHKIHTGPLSIDRMLSVRDVRAYPSVLAFDLASLPFTQDSKITAANPVDPEKSKLNDQLLEAAYQNDPAAAKEALDAGANVNAADAYGNTALMLAAESSTGPKNADVVRLLLDKGADADIRDPSGLSALEHTNLLATVYTKGMIDAIKVIKKAQKEAR